MKGEYLRCVVRPAQSILTAVIVSQHIVNILAKDNATGKSQSMAIASLSRLSDRTLRRRLLMLNNSQQSMRVEKSIIF